jgi:hypothetical protein
MKQNGSMSHHEFKKTHKASYGTQFIDSNRKRRRKRLFELL